MAWSVVLLRGCIIAASAATPMCSRQVKEAECCGRRWLCTLNIRRAVCVIGAAALLHHRRQRRDSNVLKVVGKTAMKIRHGAACTLLHLADASFPANVMDPRPKGANCSESYTERLLSCTHHKHGRCLKQEI